MGDSRTVGEEVEVLREGRIPEPGKREGYEANWELIELQNGSNFGKNPSRGQPEA